MERISCVCTNEPGAQARAAGFLKKVLFEKYEKDDKFGLLREAPMLAAGVQF